MSAEPPGRLLDITRLVSRVGRGPLTGIDRVERAYLAEIARRGDPAHLLLRTPLGFLWLPKQAGPRILKAAGGAEGSAVVPRELATDRSSRLGLAAMIRRNMPRGGRYLNVGHSNLSDRTLRQIGRGGLRISVMIHDTIPLDFPHYGGPGAAARFDTLLHAVAGHADDIICTARSTAADVERACRGRSRIPPTRIACLGTETLPADPESMAIAARRDRPYFVSLGTIEPRKNHRLLLDIWDELTRTLPADRVPDLLVIGARGWNNADVFARLDRHRRPETRVHEMSGLGDGMVTALLLRARALLMPSVTEGFGMPVAEAASLGTPVVCTDLPVYRETVGDYPVYAPPHDMYPWVKTIIRLAGGQASDAMRVPRQVPNWADHFSIVLDRD